MRLRGVKGTQQRYPGVIVAGRRIHRHRSFVAVGGVVLVALGVGGCGSTDVAGAPVERKTFPFEGRALTIDSDDSELVLVPADVEDVEVTRQVDGWVVAGEGPEARWGMEGGKLTLRLGCDAMISNCRARYEVRVPRAVAVTVENDHGAVTADGFRTALRIRSDNGKVVVRDGSGPLDVQSGNGEIAVERSTSRNVIARADNGEVRLALAACPTGWRPSATTARSASSCPAARAAAGTRSRTP